MASGLDVKTAYARLARGRTYGPAPAGMTTIRTTASDGLVIENLVEVPEAYDPARRWPVRVQLHGGVSRPPGDSDARPLASNRIRGEDAIYVHPRGHARAEWWHLNQYENMIALLDRLKRTYNVDENRVYLTGVSDGGTGVYFFAMKLPTPFSAFLPLNGNMRVLATPGTRANGQLYAGNAVNRPWFVVNGGRDPLYPVAAVAPHIEMLKAAGATIDFRPQPDAGHDTSWWPSERVAFERFVRDHPRQPHPAAVSWETERTDRYNRVHWLVINELARRPNEDPALADVNRFSAPGGEQRMFARVWPSGRVDARRQGNTFIVHSRGAASFTLLLSPDAIDVAAPVSVWVNGRSAFDGRVTEDLATLVRWAAIDGDRTMLYTVELRVQVP
jgi:predicted esterase